MAGPLAPSSRPRLVDSIPSVRHRVARRLLGIPAEEATFARRGFTRTGPRAQAHLEAVGHAFLRGYHAALERDDPWELAGGLAEVDRALVGFAFEGAAMALALLDGLTPWKRDRVAAFLAGPGAPHVYMVHVGVGWAMARLPWRRLAPPGPPLDPFLRWLAIDGYGFHEGYFHPARHVRHRAPPSSRATPYTRRAFDQGLGRALWFADGASPEHVAGTIGAFPPGRRPDLWSGVGLAAAYAGGTDATGLTALRRAAGALGAHVAQGAAFASKARQRAGNVTPHTELAVRILCGVPAAAAAAITDEALAGLRDEGDVPAYEVWRRRIRRRLVPGEVCDAG